MDLFDISCSEEEVILHQKLMWGDYLEDFEIKKCERWLNKLILANHSNKVYSAKHIYNLFENQIILAIHNSRLGGWSIEKEMLNTINTLIPHGKSILEFGSGKGTKALLKKYEVTSIEHDEKWFVQRKKNH